MASKEEILINVTPQETRVALIDNGVVQELHLERSLARGIVGNIYKGKVVRVLPGMQAAFVDVGLDKNGFLHAADIAKTDPAFAPAASKQTVDKQAPSKKVPAIQDLVHPGENVWVQVVKDPMGSKGARLTTELSIPSRNLVYMPLSGDDIGISQKIDSEDERQRLKEILQDLIAEHQLTGGFIIRTHAESLSEQELRNDLRFLQRLWQHINDTMKQASPASLVHADIPLSLRTMRDLVHEDIEIIRVDSKESLERVVEFAQDFIPDVADKIEYYPGERPLFDLYSVESEIQNAMQRKVKLKSGGDLVIDQTEAMTTIDVNTGSYVGRRDHADTLFKTNLEAAGEIAHQLRLRNLGGIIIVDFIDMSSHTHKKKVLEALSQGLDRDRVKTHITQMSPLGLVEITRKRTRDSLEHIMCESCEVCGGGGKVKTAQTVCYEILREILREDRQFKARGYTVVACADVIDLMLDEEANSLADLQDFIERPITLQVDPLYHQQQYDIALK